MTSVLAPIPSCSDADSKFVKEFWLKLQLIEQSEDKDESETHLPPQIHEGTVLVEEEEDEELELGMENDEDGEEEEEDEEGEFSFSRAFGGESLISADEAFLDGQIRPVFPLFNRDLLLRDGDGGVFQVTAEGPYCEWAGEKTGEEQPPPPPESPEVVCKKSNSTGFSKLRRFRELVLRSNSDGKEKFFFLHHQGHSKSNPDADGGKKVAAKRISAASATTTTAAAAAATSTTSKVKATKKKAESSAFERVYAMRKKEEGSKQRVSYLTYKQVGFFASVNGLSKNVHPY